jgi:hypothetical protein
MVSRSIFICFVVFQCFFSFAQNKVLTDYKIIGNQTGLSQLNTAQLKEYFKGKYTLWNSGKSVKVVLHSSQSQHALILAKLLYNTTQQGVQKYWLSLVFQGRANPPVFLDNDSDIVNYVTKTPGAIGLIDRNSSCPSNLIIQFK